MALVFKDGKYYQSNNGVLKEYSPTSLAGDYYSGAISQNDFNLVQNSVNPKSTNLAANSYSVPTSVPTNQNNAFNEFTQFAATAPSNIAQSGSVASVPQTRVPTYEEYVAQQNLPKGPNLAANPFAVPASTPATLTPAEQQFLDFTALAGAMPETVIPTTNTGVTNYTPAGTNESTGFDLQSILDLLTGIGNTPAQGTNEDYNVTTSQSELGQALQDEALRGLNGQFGYTADEQAAIYKNAIDQFNATQEADLLKLQNLYEQYGISNPTGMGGQGGSSLQDYYGKRALAQEDLTTNLAQQFSDKATQEKQYAIQNAMGINSQLYEQQRGDFADMLSLMGFNADMDAQTFNQQLQLMGFESDQAQQQFLNQQGISDREIANYFQTLNTENSMNQWWTEYLQSTQIDPNMIAQLLGGSESDIAHLLTQGANNYQNTDSPYSSLAMMLGLLTTQGNNTGNNTNTNGTTGGIGSTSLNLPTIPGVNWGDPTSWLPDVAKTMFSLGGKALPQVGGTFTYNGHTYTYGANGKITDNTVLDANGNPVPQTEIGAEQPKSWWDSFTGGKPSDISGGVGLIGDAVTVYALANIVGDVWKSRTINMSDSELKASYPYKAYTLANSGDINGTITNLNSISNNPLSVLATMSLMRYGDVNKGLPAVILDAQEEAKLANNGFGKNYNWVYKLASDQSFVRQVAASVPTTDSTPTQYLDYITNGLNNYVNNPFSSSQYHDLSNYSELVKEFATPTKGADYLKSLNEINSKGLITPAQYTQYMNDYNQITNYGKEGK